MKKIRTLSILLLLAAIAAPASAESSWSGWLGKWKAERNGNSFEFSEFDGELITTGEITVANRSYPTESFSPTFSKDGSKLLFKYKDKPAIICEKINTNKILCKSTDTAGETIHERI